MVPNHEFGLNSNEVVLILSKEPTVKTALLYSMKQINLFYILFLFSFCSQDVFAQVDISKSKLDVKKLDDHIYLFVQNTNISNPSSIVYTTKEVTLLIDPGFIQMQDLIRNSIGELGGGPIEYVMATHFHTDHSQALQNYNNEASILFSKYQYPIVKDLNLSRVFSSNNKAYSLTIADEVLEVHTLPNINGHTGSDAIYYFRNSDILVMGDYLFYDMYPIIDINNGGSINGYFDNLKYILSISTENTRFIPGHTSFKPDILDNYYSRKNLEIHISNLLESIEWVKMEKKSGADLPAILEEGLSSKFAKYNEGMKFVSEERWLTFLFNNI